MSVMTIHAMDFEELELLQAPVSLGAFFHNTVVVLKTVYNVIEKTVVIVTAYALVKAAL